MEEYARIYYIYKTPGLKLLRLTVLVVFFITIVTTFEKYYTPSTAIALLIFFAMWEVFFFFKISRMKPKSLVTRNNGENIYESFTLDALSVFIMRENVIPIVKSLLRKPNIKFILKKANIQIREIKFTDAAKDEIAKLAFDLAKNNNCLFVTTSDLFCAYILYTEPQTRLLFSKELKEKDFLHILYWAHSKFVLEEQKKPIRIRFSEEGIGENWVYGWTLETKKYTNDITAQVLKERPVLVGRDTQYKEVIEALMDTEKNSTVLVGNPGVGKTAMIKYLAFESFVGNTKGTLKHKRFLELMVSVLLAGTSNQGELQTRLTNIMEEISHAGNVILYIPKLEDILGSESLSLNLSSSLMPYVRDGKINIIATSTPSNYKTYIEPMLDFIQFFDVIKLNDPDMDSAIQMVMEKASQIEKAYKISITYKAVESSVMYANRYLRDKSLPGSAVTLLNETANSAILTQKKIIDKEDVIAKIEEAIHVQIDSPNKEETELLLHFEDKMHKKIVGQEEAVVSIATALRRLRSGITRKDKPISFLFLGPTGVGKTETAKTLANLYFKEDNSMIRIDMSEYNTQDSVKRIIDGELTQTIYEHPFSLILLDEFEKAHPDILDLFLQVLDDGRLTNSRGKTASFLDAIIIATSNAGSELIREQLKNEQKEIDSFSKKLLDTLQEKGIFKPELLNRFDSIVIFKPLGQKEIYEITGLLLTKIVQKLKEEDINVFFDEKIRHKIALEGFNEEFGARPLRRFIQNNIENALAQKILASEITRGNTVMVSTDTNNNITFSIN